MEVYKDQEPLSESELLGQLDAIVKMANTGDDQPAVGVLTTMSRRPWGRTFRKLKRGMM